MMVWTIDVGLMIQKIDVNNRMLTTFKIDIGLLITQHFAGMIDC